jgi:hypothetical protein
LLQVVEEERDEPHESRVIGGCEQREEPLQSTIIGRSEEREEEHESRVIGGREDISDKQGIGNTCLGSKIWKETFNRVFVISKWQAYISEL